MSEEGSPLLTTARLRFDWWDPGDASRLFALHADPRVQNGYPFGPEAWTKPAIDRKLAGYVREQSVLGFTRWKVRLRDGTFIGRCGWSRWEGEGLELGYALMPAFHGRGFAQEAARAAVAWAMMHTDEKLVGFAWPNNRSSRNVLEKVGMTFIDERVIGCVSHAFYELQRTVSGR